MQAEMALQQWLRVYILQEAGGRRKVRLGMAWAFKFLKFVPTVCHTSSNKITSPNPSQTVPLFGDQAF